MTATNMLSVPEIVAYRRRPIEGGAVVSYLMRQPGATAWEPVKFFIPQPDPDDRVACLDCGSPVPRHQMSAGTCMACHYGPLLD